MMVVWLFGVGFVIYVVVVFLVCMDWCLLGIVGFGEGGFVVELCGGSDFVVVVVVFEEVCGILGDCFVFLEMMVGIYC